jgi:hypothetical protein
LDNIRVCLGINQICNTTDNNQIWNTTDVLGLQYTYLFRD